MSQTASDSIRPDARRVARTPTLPRPHGRPASATTKAAGPAAHATADMGDVALVSVAPKRSCQPGRPAEGSHVIGSLVVRHARHLLHAQPGVYAVLLGSRVSTGAGVQPDDPRPRAISTHEGVRGAVTLRRNPRTLHDSTRTMDRRQNRWPERGLP